MNRLVVARSVVLTVALGAVACGGDAAPVGIADLGGAAGPDYAGCSRGVIEADLMAMPLAGPGVDPASGKLRAPKSGAYVVSSTYLTLPGTAAAGQRFGQLMGPIIERLKTQGGLVAISTGTAAGCNTARTLTVWECLDAMYNFVASSAHSAAVAVVKDVSRGQSLVTHWEEADPTKVSFSTAALKLTAISGPLY